MTGAPSPAQAPAFLRGLFECAVAAADPGAAVRAHLPEKPKGRCVVVGAGKASAAMAAALDTAWPDVDLSGVVVTRYGHKVPAGRIEIIEAAHPVPDDNSLLAARRIIAAVSGLSSDDLVIALVSGGGSALMTLPAGKMTLTDKQDINRQLLASGATIAEMNTVRRALSAIKGGRLAAAAAPARVLSLLISDVPGDRASDIASGPTVENPDAAGAAQDIVARYRISLPQAAKDVLHEARPVELRQTPETRIIASPSMALAAAANAARAAGVTPVILGDAIEGEAAQMGIVMAGIARSVHRLGQPVRAPALLLSGGEGTVTIGPEKPGRGGRNTEFLLALTIALAAEPDVYAIAGDSDGIDGTDDAAGAIITPETLAEARAAGLNPRAFLAAHDSYSFFDALGQLVRTGPTMTNVNDIRAILIL